MNSKAVALIFLILLQLKAEAQILDSLRSKKPTLNNIYLCAETVTRLNREGDFKVVTVEEMDLSANCGGQDSRFIAGKGYYSEAFPGLIFQKDQQTDFISKIRIDKRFKGKLPDGNYVDMSNFLLKDMMKLYPQLKDKWGSRDCSNYWNFSDDAISFYVRIDPARLPQFPVDEKYYADKPIEAIDLVTSCYSIYNKSDSTLVFDSTDPMYYIDSVQVKKSALADIVPEDIAIVTVYKDTNAVKLKGAAAKNGLIYMETKKFVKLRYWNYFKSKSVQYARIVPSAEDDAAIQYIVNKKILKDYIEGDLALINDSNFDGIDIISKEQLAKDYGIKGKEYGVIIHSKSANTINGKAKPK